ncbi:MAG: ATP synthase F1 subunit delta [Bdellovibrionales bacterium RIFOXYD12_FULL_39_22]|nr:MAG: ATP synthase F1 subunit delta [Bdellovibrionales bacterium RIFOXYB1_FULL_39_21]OFZ45192.1 MAG: ATP synthase F1 subunit delta [Bdellovibrionales bacterium RIFOXYC12_FULL_39_17]OFZ45616.1 MAG: ATP synthase F1 subunit delta [Bdellovibrionales bacterium RIFOXYC1_FULL_39_130]OFZ77478.1 MAG: ATP synthase F1 subunit delta [Bdellovibrionales bacterium RIFOXYD1_FULL_39_84]OFZ91607.1 MAG: ATP synthase F1 subunit delta [Bdellovibrionales bacterium RIFOXYD12_FULL_39_22]HLE11931.1 ATP synthase F1 s
MSTIIAPKSYAQAITDLAEKNKIDLVSDFARFNEALNGNLKFEQFLFLDVFTIEEKATVVKEVALKLSLSKIFTNFLYFLIEEKRIGMLPSIYKDVVVLEDDRKGFMRGVIEGSEQQINEADKEKLVGYLKKKLGKDIELTYQQKNSVAAGYRVTVGDLQLDASIDNQLEKLKHEVLNS